MKIIISPTKKMKVSTDDYTTNTLPIFNHEAQSILNFLKNQNIDSLKNIYKCNDKILEENISRLNNPLINNCAILSYQGLQFQNMAAHLFSKQQLDYVSNNLVILSAVYGMLRPLDSINLYRLEMNASINYDNHTNLYSFWSNKIYTELYKDQDIIINLASKEYYDVIKKHLHPNDIMINIKFAEIINEKVISKATLAKMARGSMVRFMAENNIDNIDDIKLFNDFNFKFNDQLSDETNLVFIK